MYRLSRLLIPTLAALLMVSAPLQAGSSGSSSDDSSGSSGSRNPRYSVKVTNLTRGQIMSPPVVVSHNRDIGLFELGQPAIPQLAALAEDADSVGLVDLLWGSSAVHDVNQAGGVILPGQSVSVEIEVRRNRRLISLASMLVTTNDAFTALRNVRVPLRGRTSMRAVAYDAGSEANDEDCDSIPGPPCGNPFQHPDEAGEGYVHIHAGVHGGSSLNPAQHDWRNPVAEVSITRIH